MASSITHRQRLEACIAGEKPDRPPIALWRHFPVDDQHPALLAAATLDFQRRYDFDFIKVTPASSFASRDWGVQDIWLGNIDGSRKYTQRVIQNPEDWFKLQVLDPVKGSLGNQLKCLQIINERINTGTPFIQTVFSPLSIAKYLVGDQGLLVHLRRYPDAVHAGLFIITETVRRFVRALYKLVSQVSFMQCSMPNMICFPSMSLLPLGVIMTCRYWKVCVAPGSMLFICMD